MDILSITRLYSIFKGQWVKGGYFLIKLSEVTISKQAK